MIYLVWYQVHLVYYWIVILYPAMTLSQVLIYAELIFDTSMWILKGQEDQTRIIVIRNEYYTRVVQLILVTCMILLWHGSINSISTAICNNWCYNIIIMLAVCLTLLLTLGSLDGQTRTGLVVPLLETIGSELDRRNEVLLQRGLSSYIT